MKRTRILVAMAGVLLILVSGCGAAAAAQAAGPPLPPLRWATATDLIGTWVPADGSGRGAPHRPSVTLRADKSYTGTDGCNGVMGRWTSGPGGELHATSGPSTLMGCADMLGVPGWLAQATRAGFDGDVLVLLDGNGAETGRLRAA